MIQRTTNNKNYIFGQQKNKFIAWPTLKNIHLRFNNESYNRFKIDRQIGEALK